MSAKHTPGPWVWKELSPDKDLPEAVSLMGSDGECVLAEVWHNDETTGIGLNSENPQADAALIAAAPEMGEMLRSTFLHVSHGGPTREQVEAVLKKAGLL